MNRIDRLTAILIQLQSKKVVRAEEIADRFEISLRTVYRDVKALMEAGVPIGSEAGTGYFIVDGYHLPPVMFNQEEASALLMACCTIISKALLAEPALLGSASATCPARRGSARSDQRSGGRVTPS